jgi:hypothetical protein
MKGDLMIRKKYKPASTRTHIKWKYKNISKWKIKSVNDAFISWLNSFE